jgi:putative addiction module CopG family antidote
MSESQAMTVHLSPESREFVRLQVERGEYASADDVLNHSVASLRLEAEERERWIREEVLAANEEHARDPRTSVSLDELKRELTEWRAERQVSA